MEPPQNRDLNALVPELRRKVVAIRTQLLAEGYRPIITETGRTADRQAWLLKNKKSTVKHSKHQDGRACDFAFIKNGKAVWNPLYKGWRRLGAAAKNHGLIWGGGWLKFKDCPHVELP